MMKRTVMRCRSIAPGKLGRAKRKEQCLRRYHVEELARHTCCPPTH
jgi:hypothetical protein